MKLVIELPSREEQRLFNAKRWQEVCADAFLASLPHRIETDAFGHIIMSPPPLTPHARRATRIVRLLEDALPEGEAFTECPISTNDGVRAADAVWISRERLENSEDEGILPIAPEICVEVLSPSNTPAEMRHKANLYFDAGAEEVWLCEQDGTMRYFAKAEPQQSLEHSPLVPTFPKRVMLR